MEKSRYEFELIGLDELRRDLAAVQKEYPDDVEVGMQSIALKFTKDVNKRMPDRYSNQKGHILKSWKRTKQVEGVHLAAFAIENTSKAWHLVENGHVLWGNPRMAKAYLGGKLKATKRKKRQMVMRRGQHIKGTVKLGKVNAKGYCEATRQDWKDSKFVSHVRNMIHIILLRHNL